MSGAREVVLTRYPAGAPSSDDFASRPSAVPEPAEGEALVRVTHLSMDPFPRMRMRPDSRVGPPMPLGRAVEGRGLGVVEESRDPSLKPGDLVAGELGWRTHAAVPAAGLEKLDRALGPPEKHLSVLGPSGLTAYFTAHVVGAPKPGETVLVAPAAGSVGSVAVQIARAAGARVVGVATGAQCAHLTGVLGCHDAADHRDVAAEVARACPDGVDLFIDGVGGEVHEAGVAALKPGGRAVLIGFISGYGEGPRPYGSMLPVLFKRLDVRGFLLADWRDRFPEGLERLSAWLADGSIRPVETVWEGLDQAPAAFASLFADARPGKQIVKVGE